MCVGAPKDFRSGRSILSGRTVIFTSATGSGSMSGFPQSGTSLQAFQKLEWNCQGERRDVWSYILQFRASGIRVKRPTTAPSLVAMTTSQVPVVGWERRYMTIRECSRLQSMGTLKNLPHTQSGAFKALGNAVNADVVREIAKNLLGCCTGVAEESLSDRNEQERGKKKSDTAIQSACFEIKLRMGNNHSPCF